MKIIEQLTEDTFVVKMDEWDLQKEDAIKVAHDYVAFYGNVGITTENSVTVHGKYASCRNWVRQFVELQIPIKEMVEVILPYLNTHEYCRLEHLITSDGYPNYCFNDNAIFFKDNDSGEEMVAVRAAGEEKFSIITRKLYNHLKGK